MTLTIPQSTDGTATKTTITNLKSSGICKMAELDAGHVVPYLLLEVSLCVHLCDILVSRQNCLRLVLVLQT
jgi:hypothetical protein